MTKLSDYVFKFIASQGIKNVFLLPGGGCMHLVDSLGNNKHLNAVCCLHEQACAIAADGAAQYSNRLGACLVTTGPGGTNTLTGVAASWIDSTPLLVISGQVKSGDMIRNSRLRQKGIQEIDIVSIVKPITKYAVTVLKPESIRYHLEKAVYLAQAGRRGPVWIDIPLDVQGAFIDERRLKRFKPQADRFFPKLPSKIEKTIDLLNRSRRPVILLGNGARSPEALNEFNKFKKASGIPVLTTWKAADLLAGDDPSFFGRPGSISLRAANFIQQNSDLIICIGSRLDLAQVAHNYRNFAPRAKKIIIDIDANELKKIGTKVDLSICSDALVFLRALNIGAKKIKMQDIRPWLQRCRQWRKKYASVPIGKSRFVNTYVFIDILSKAMRKDDCLVPGSSGTSSEMTLQYFKVKKGQRVINSPGLGSMGFGLPQSIGVCLESGKKRTISIIGDGGLQHNIQELQTLASLRLPVKLFVINNNGYASIRNSQKNHFRGNYVCCDPQSGLTFPNLEKVAIAYAIRYFKICKGGDLPGTVEKVLNCPGPAICEVFTDPYLFPAPRVSSVVRKDGSIVSSSLENLFPFLNREELEENTRI